MTSPPFGLTDICMNGARCDRCDLPLDASTYKDVKVFFSTTPKNNRGFLCIKCATKSRVSIREVEKAINELVSVV